jgi:L-lactate dehydrogenase complex protein LldG
VALFCAQAQRAGATLSEVESAEQVPAAVQAYLAATGQATELVAGADPWLQALPWDAAGLTLAWRCALATDAVALAHAPLAVAETGSLVLRSGTATPTSSNFLPETQVVALQASAIVAHLEDAWAALRAAGLPRAVNLITGPSRTADIEQTLQLGAHGPRWLHIVLVHGA